jgi:rhomboid protease GluP
MSPRGAPFTTAMLFIFWLVFLLDQLSRHGAALGEFMTAGAIIPSLVVAGQWWRLITYGFLHFNFAHILFNSYALFQAGVFVEYVYGSMRYAVIYTIALIGGGIAAYLWTIGTNDVTAGASGAIMGVFGAMAVLAFKLPPLRRELFQAAAIPIILTLGYGFFSPGISNAGHIGGVICGAVTAACLRPARGDDMVRQLRLGQGLNDPS